MHGMKFIIVMPVSRLLEIIIPLTKEDLLVFYEFMPLYSDNTYSFSTVAVDMAVHLIPIVCQWGCVDTMIFRNPHASPS